MTPTKQQLADMSEVLRRLESGDRCGRDGVL